MLCPAVLTRVVRAVPKRRPRLQPSQSTHFIQGGASEAGKSTFWSTNADDARSESSDDESSEDPELDEQNDDTWLEQQRDKLDRAAQARNRRDRGSDVSDISTDDEMEQGVEAPPKGGGRPGAGRPGRKLQVGKTVSFSAANIGQPGGGNVAGSDGADGDSSPQHFRPKQLAGTPAVDVALPADSDSAVAQASGADQAPPAWMFKANAGAPNTKYLQKLDEPKKDENKEFRGKFMMNSFIVAQNAMQSFNNGRKLKRKERKGKVANVEKYQTKVACTFCERVRKDDPPWYWSEVTQLYTCALQRLVWHV